MKQPDHDIAVDLNPELDECTLVLTAAQLKRLAGVVLEAPNGETGEPIPPIIPPNIILGEN